MQEIHLRDTLPRAREVALLFLVRALACASAYGSGFRALSDDDYARITIAQRFAASPHFDPSGSSWLPAPFWVYGTAFRLFGHDLAVARGVAVALALGATWLVYVGARVVGLGRLGALLAAALSSLLPYSALLGIAAVPEVPCSALILFGAATLARPSLTLRALGGLGLTLACWSRYEAWPVALAFALVTLWDSRARAPLAVAALLASLGPLSWLLVGHIEHHDASFFITRVTSYRRALGAVANDSLVTRVLEYPKLLFFAEPELWAIVALTWLLDWRRDTKHEPRAYGRPALALTALLLFMVVGSVRDGVPTHHAARVLLPIWFLLSLPCGDAFERWSLHWPRRRALAAFGGATLAVWVGLFARPRLLPREGFAQRADELRVGAEAKARKLTSIAIDTRDYGYFAVQAAFGDPADSVPLVDHDPRRHDAPDPFADAATLRTALQAHASHALIATRAHKELAASVCAARWASQAFSLFECSPAPPAHP